MRKLLALLVVLVFALGSAAAMTSPPMPDSDSGDSDEVSAPPMPGQDTSNSTASSTAEKAEESVGSTPASSFMSGLFKFLGGLF